jgi:hypothetical protein
MQRHGYTEGLIGALFLGALLYGIVTLAAENKKALPPLPVSPEMTQKYAARLDELDVEAIEMAYKEQIQVLFAGWMKDATGQPARAMNGAANARNAFIAAMHEIETRQALRQREPR